ncbi:MAG: E3 binding domain-containing protein, partial [Bacteroidales bacterium]|nr:E3 binding domain-containing protein [Bacteroidales bacterium]
MRYIFKFPDIGEGLDEGTIVEWYVKKGESVEVGQSLVKMETDKVVTDIPSPREGTISAMYGKEGETINVGDALVEIEIEGVEGKQAVEESKKIEQEQEAVEEEGAGVVGTLEVAGNNAYLPASDEGMDDQSEGKPSNKRKALATPVARALAKELDIDINQVNGTGPGGRVMKDDIQKFKQQNAYKAPQQTTSAEQTGNFIETEKLTQIRKSIAKNMVESKHNAAHMTVFDDAEVSESIRVRNKFKKQFADEDSKLNYLPFILKATA